MQYEKVQADRVGDAGGLYGNGMTAFPALAEPLGIQGESRVETGITVVSNTYTYGNAAVTSY